MENKEYLLIRGDEDGEPCTFLSKDQMFDLLKNPEDWGIDEFLDGIPIKDPAYWGDGIALLLEIKILKPKVAATAFKL